MRLLIFASCLTLSLFALDAAAASKVRITEIKVFDEGFYAESGSIPQVDVIQDICSVEDDETEYEPFYDTVASIRVVNRRSSTIRFTAFSYKVETESGVISATKFPPTGGFEVASGKNGSAVLSLFLRAYGGAKYFTGSDSAISPALGIRPITFALRGRDGARKRVRVRGRITVKFSNYDRCG